MIRSMLRRTVIGRQPWDFQDFNVVSIDSLGFGIPDGLSFNSDGTIMVVGSRTTNRIYKFILSTPWDVSTKGTSVQNFLLSSPISDCTGFFISEDGLNAFFADDNTTEFVHHYTMSVAYDLSTLTFVSSLVIPQRPRDVQASPDGTKLFVMDEGATDFIREYNLSTPWDLTTATFVQEVEGIIGSVAHGIFMRKDGLMYFELTENEERYICYTLSTAFDLSTRTLIYNILIEPTITLPRSIYASDDGLFLYIINDLDDSIYTIGL